MERTHMPHTKFDLCSDLHLGFLAYMPKKDEITPEIYIQQLFKPTESETLLVAGDIQEDLALERPWAKLFFETAAQHYKNIVCVLGNHDFWSNTVLFPDVIDLVKERYPSVTFLENEQTEIDGVRIFGATFWSPIRPESEVPVIQTINDFWNVKTAKDQSLIPAFINEKNKESVAKLKKFLTDSPANAKNLVLTHHAPSSICNTRYPHSAIEDAFCNHLDDFIFDSPINVWCYGHIHEEADLLIGKTRIVANPHGNLFHGLAYPNHYGFKTIEL